MNVRVNALRFVGCAIAISAFLFASGSLSSGCGSASTGAGSDAGDSGTGGNTFHVDISLTSGLITFPNKYSGWAVGGSSATNFVAYPSGWSVGGGSATNFIAVPAGWSVGGGSATNFVAYAPGWSVGGGSATNYVAVPAGWTVGGGSATNFIALPALPGWSAGGGSTTNYTALPPGWSSGGGSTTNFIALPPGWLTGWRIGDEFRGLSIRTRLDDRRRLGDELHGAPSGLECRRRLRNQFRCCPARLGRRRWILGQLHHVSGARRGDHSSKIRRSGLARTAQGLQDGGSYSESTLADIVIYAFLNVRAAAPHRVEAPAGEW